VGEAAIPRAPLWALLALGGLALVLEPWRDPGEGLLLCAALGSASAVGYAGNVLVLRRLAPLIGPVRAIGYHGLLAAGLLALFADRGALLDAQPLRVGWLVAGAVLLAGLASLVFTRGLQAVGSTRATMLAYLEPLVAVIVGWLAWSERLSPLALLGGALILVAGLSASLSRTPGPQRNGD
jgi:drug/metabolite transporter (DMT)-like permease